MPEFKFFVKTLKETTETFGEKDNLYPHSTLNKLFDVVSKRFGLQSSELRLKFESQELRIDAKKTLQTYNIQSNDILIEAPYFSFFVYTIEGKNLIFGQENNLYPDTDVSDLFDVVSSRVNIPKEEIRLVYLGKQFDADSKQKLSDYKINKNSTLILILRLRGGKRRQNIQKQ